jgi:hypothetical protein
MDPLVAPIGGPPERRRNLIRAAAEVRRADAGAPLWSKRRRRYSWLT